MVEYQCSLIVRASAVVGLDLNAVVGVQVFLDDLEGSGDDGLIVVFQSVAQHLLQRLGVHPSGNSLFVGDFPASRHHRLFIAHIGFDFVCDGFHLSLKFFSQLAEFHEFFDLGDDALIRVAHCSYLTFVFCRWVHVLLTVIIIQHLLNIVNGNINI